MTESNQEPASGAALPKPLVRESRRLSIVWLIPIVAALSGGFLAWKAISERGPEVTILFDSASGIVPEKTKIKYRDVEVGVIDAIGFNDDLSKVEATASLAKWIEPYLTENTKFWVVTARVSAQEVTGLDTLLGGAYIGMEPSTFGEPSRDFAGLPKPPIVASDETGSFFELRSSDLGSLGIGAPVFYRSLQVGRIVEEELDASGRSFDMKIFIDAPHDERVRSTTLFWNASGIDATLGPDGVELNSPSIVSMLVGGIEFGRPPDAEPGVTPAEGAVFTLYESKSKALEPKYAEKNPYLLRFTGSVAGLRVGSPVEFQGIPIGQVADVSLVYDFDSHQMEIPVIIETEPERLTWIGQPAPDESREHELQGLIDKGLRARLCSESLITGGLKVELEFVDDVEPVVVDFSVPVPELPTAPAALEGITDSLAGTLRRVEELPLEEVFERVDRILGELETTSRRLNSDIAPSVEELLAEFKGLASQMNSDIAPSVTAAIESLQTTIDTADALIDQESGTPQEVQSILREVAAAARSLRVLAERLETHPEELLRGKSK